MKCNGTSELCGERCIECGRLFDDCEGSPDYADYNGDWVTVEELEMLVIQDLAENEYKAEKSV